jgi:uncharacterized membrane protein YobD (UPF0266 family)
MDDEQQEPEKEANWQYNSENSSQPYDGSNMAESNGVPLPTIPSVEWTASEYVAHEKSAGWYGALFAGSILIIVLVFVITRDVLASIVVLLSCIAISIYAARKPATNKYIINEKGVQVQERFRPYSEFRSFSIVEEGAIDTVWLKPLKRFSPPVVMHFSPEDEQKITDVLANFLPHEDRELDAIDRFSKRMRF